MKKKRLTPANLGSRHIRKGDLTRLRDVGRMSCQTCLMLKSQESFKEEKKTQPQKLCNVYIFNHSIKKPHLSLSPSSSELIPQISQKSLEQPN